jgi:hypothetical protein
LLVETLSRSEVVLILFDLLSALVGLLAFVILFYRIHHDYPQFKSQQSYHDHIMSVGWFYTCHSVAIHSVDDSMQRMVGLYSPPPYASQPTLTLRYP